MTSRFDPQEGLKTLKDCGAFLEGHFLLTTGRHSDQFFLFARLTESPSLLMPWVRALAQQLRVFDAKTVAAPAIGGIIPAFAVALEWQSTRMIFAEKEAGGGMRFRRGFRIAPGEPVVVVEDAVTTGSSVAQVIDAVQTAGGVVKAVGAFIDRSQGPLAFTQPLVALIKTSAAGMWEPAACPLCAAHIPLTKPKA